MKTNFYKKFSRFGLTLGGYLTALCQVTTTHFSKQQSRHSPARQASGQRTGGQAPGPEDRRAGLWAEGHFCYPRA